MESHAEWNTHGEQSIGADQAPGSLDCLETELNYLEESVTQLAARLTPVLNQYSDESAKHAPRAEPPSRMRALIERLTYLRYSLDETRGRIDL